MGALVGLTRVCLRVLGAAIDPETLARATPGMSGADLETLVNGAALRAAKRDSPFVTIEDIDEAKDKLMLGPARRNKVVKPETLKKTAYHEGGHTLVALLTKHAMPIYKTTILPRGQTAGVVRPPLCAVPMRLACVG